MHNRRRSLTWLLAGVLTAAGLVAGSTGSAAAQPDPPTWTGVNRAAQHAAKLPRVSLTVATRVPVGATVKITGTVRPAAPRSTVKLRSRSSGAWHTVATKKLTRGSTYRFSQKFAATPSSRQFRVVVPRHGATHKVMSAVRTARAAFPGHDVSHPQCQSVLPGGSFGIVGVDGGRPFDANPCLASEISWAAAVGRPAYYANTANPGPTLSTHWPIGQQQPRVCAPSSQDSTDCAYDYGWNAAADSYARAAAAAASVGAPAVSGATWWLDAETGNTWESLEFGETAANYANDTAALTGMRAYLRSQGVGTVGVYSTAHQWQRITGGASLSRAPVWYAGLGGPSSAAAHCASTFSFTGGRVRLTQYVSGGFDADNAC